MKFKINRDHFVTGLQQVLNVVGTKASMPILSNVLIKADGDHVTLTTTNLELGIRCQIKAAVESPGSITLPVRKLATIVRALPNIEVRFETDEEQVQAHIQSGGSKFKMVGLPEGNFPALPSFEDQHVFNMPQDELARMLKSVSYAQSNDENRFILNGVFFDFADDKLTLAATDGRRLAVTGCEISVTAENAGKLILPAKTVSELERLLGQGDEVRITFSERQVAFTIQIGKDSEKSGLTDSIYLVSKIVEGNYPNYQQVIPKETGQRIKIERELLLECVQRAALVTSDKETSVLIEVRPNLLEITGHSPDFGESHETMAIQYDGPEVRVSFNPQYMMDPLRSLTKDEVFFEFKDEMSPGVFRTLETFLCVIMPLRSS